MEPATRSKLSLILYILCACSICSGASAAEWVVVSGNENVQVALDKDSLVRSTPTTVDVWIKWSWATPQKAVWGTKHYATNAESYQSSDNQPVYYTEEIYQSRFDCQMRTVQERVRHVKNGGTLVQVPEFLDPSKTARDPEPIAPETLTENIFDLLCKEQPTTHAENNQAPLPSQRESAREDVQSSISPVIGLRAAETLASVLLLFGIGAFATKRAARLQISAGCAIGGFLITWGSATALAVLMPSLFASDSHPLAFAVPALIGTTIGVSFVFFRSRSRANR